MQFCGDELDDFRKFAISEQSMEELERDNNKEML